MMLSHPHPEEEPPPKKLPPHPHPSLPLLQKASRIIIHIMELHPHPPLRLLVPHPQFVAVKSLIVLPPKFFLFMVYTMWDGLVVFPVAAKKMKNFLGGGRICRSSFRETGAGIAWPGFLCTFFGGFF